MGAKGPGPCFSTRDTDPRDCVITCTQNLPFHESTITKSLDNVRRRDLRGWGSYLRGNSALVHSF